jgi:proline dehydrogenase
VLLRQAILVASRSALVRSTLTRAPLSRSVVRRFVAGESTADAVRVARALIADGLCVTLDHLGEDTTDAGQADATVQAYEELLAALHAEGLTEGGRAEVSVKLSAVGLEISAELAEVNLRQICLAAQAVGTTVTVDMEGSALTAQTLEIVERVRLEHPDLGAVVQAMLRRTELDCRQLAVPGSRVRLCKGAYAEREEVSVADTDVSYVRCLRVLMQGRGRPLVATHDPRLVELALRLVGETGRSAGSYELQMLLGVRPQEQRRLAAAGHLVRVYVPYGGQWYGYLMRRLAERPANLTFFARALLARD